VYFWKLRDVWKAMYLVLVTIEEIVIADDEEGIIKIIIQQSQSADGIVKGGDIDGRSHMMPISTKDAGPYSSFLSLGDHPSYESFTRVVMIPRVVSHSVVYVGEHSYLGKIRIVGHVGSLLNALF
jgi:hypothetical protein